MRMMFVDEETVYAVEHIGRLWLEHGVVNSNILCAIGGETCVIASGDHDVMCKLFKKIINKLPGCKPIFIKTLLKSVSAIIDNNEG